jgi:hypothetical protein
MWPAVPGEALQLTGHFDDPHSGSCELWGPDPDLQPGVPPTFEDKASVVLICREQFVVTDVTVAVGS